MQYCYIDQRGDMFQATREPNKRELREVEMGQLLVLKYDEEKGFIGVESHPHASLYGVGHVEWRPLRTQG